MQDITTNFIGRLRARDSEAWFELWEIFGPILRAQLMRWGKGRIGVETVQDLSQETMAALSSAIDRHDPTKGARFSTWLLTIARYTLGDELDRRTAIKRGGGRKPSSLDDSFTDPGVDDSPDQAYELEVFDAKVEAALKAVEHEVGFMEFEVFRQRILEGRSGKDVAQALGMSEPTVSRRLAVTRQGLKKHLWETVARFSFTDEEFLELERNGLEVHPNKKRDDASFDESIAEVYHRICQRNAHKEQA